VELARWPLHRPPGAGFFFLFRLPLLGEFARHGLVGTWRSWTGQTSSNMEKIGDRTLPTRVGVVSPAHLHRAGKAILSNSDQMRRWTCGSAKTKYSIRAVPNASSWPKVRARCRV